MKAMTYEKTPITVKGMRTKNMKKLEASVVADFTDWALISVPIKELWKRHSSYFWITGFWVELAIIIWSKLG